MSKTKTTTSTDSSTRHIEVSNKKIVYTLKNDNVSDYMTYNQTLYDILSLDRLKPFRDEGRLRLRVYCGGKDEDIYLYDLAIACCLGRVNVDTFLDDLRRFKAWKRKRGYTVDHADGNLQNNTALNLSLMPGAQNRIKSDLASRVEKPSLLVSCYDGSEYRIRAEFKLSDSSALVGLINTQRRVIVNEPTAWAVLNFVCATPEDYVACLRKVVTTRLIAEGATLVEPMQGTNGWSSTGQGSFLDDTLLSIRMQELLSGLPANQFNRFVSQS